ncbi:MAG: (d)CMP kinase [Rhodobacteraceae bacterium]|nr:(d)CMP kinase [Paracoccaceae bacterium]
MSFCVAIDGPAAAGKGTIAKSVATHFELPHLDSGLLYRAVGARELQGEDPVSAAEALDPSELDAEKLRTAEIAKAASRVAVIPEVRAALVDFQRVFAQRAGGAVIDGRDIGTVIAPDAAVKLFVTASVEARAERRHAELMARGEASDLAQVRDDVAARDRRDRERTLSPLVAAEDALTLDTTDLTIEEAVEAAIAAVAAKR